jgi:hypothetical protein
VFDHASNYKGAFLKKALVLITVAISVAGSGCTAQQAYYAGQTWQRNECSKIADSTERERCMGSTNTSYETYKRQTEDSRKP